MSWDQNQSGILYDVCILLLHSPDQPLEVKLRLLFAARTASNLSAINSENVVNKNLYNPHTETDLNPLTCLLDNIKRNVRLLKILVYHGVF